MPLSRVVIDGFKSIEHCDINLTEKNLVIGENGSGKSNLLDAISYFYSNLTENMESNDIYDINNRFSNEVKISLRYDLSRFEIIAKKNFLYDLKSADNKYQGYYKKILQMLSKSNDNIINIELTQIKGKTIQWNVSYEDREFIKTAFPLFAVDTRNLNLNNWTLLWEEFGDLVKISNSERKIIQSQVSDILNDSGNETSEKMKNIIDTLESSGVNVKRNTSKKFAQNIVALYLDGDSLQYNGKNLDYYSTGTNSMKYVELLLKIADAISKVKLKEPLILLDEPEVSLHSRFIDELCTVITETSSRLGIIISTHSSRLIKNLIKHAEKLFLFDTKKLREHTVVRKMENFAVYSAESKYRVTDDFINSYFSRAVLFVEGESELELFSNPYIRALFPKLYDVEVVKAESDEKSLKIMDPKKLKTKTPYLHLIDMDKVFEYDKENNKFIIKKGLTHINRSDHFQYRSKHTDRGLLIHQYKRVKNMSEKLKIHYNLPFYSCNERNFKEFINAIQIFMIQRNYFVLSTTIEGTLVCSESKEYAKDYLKTRIKSSSYNAFEKYLSTLTSDDQTNFLRIIYNGKPDLILTKKQLQLSEDLKKIIDCTGNFSKTEWISEYIEGFIVKKTGKKMTENEFKLYIKRNNKKRNLAESFKSTFPELYLIIEKACNLLYY